MITEKLLIKCIFLTILLEISVLKFMKNSILKSGKFINLYRVLLVSKLWAELDILSKIYKHYKQCEGAHCLSSRAYLA